MAQWMELQQWIFPQRFFRENLKLGEGGEEGRENDIVRETFELAVERLVVRRVHRDEIAWTAIAGTTLLFIGGMVWVFIDPALSGTGFLLSTVGVLVTGLAVLGTLWYAGRSRIVRIRHAATLQPPRVRTVH
jgi:hypothetical protein